MNETGQARSRHRWARPAAGLLALLTTLLAAALTLGGGTASAATPSTSTATDVRLTPAQAGQFTRQVDMLAGEMKINGTACLQLDPVPYPCGWVFSKSMSQAIWKAVVNKPITAVANYCRDLLPGGLDWVCDRVANTLRNLTAPNGRCLFIGAKISSRGLVPVVKYTTQHCV
ncbi:hypothetical protein KIPE111705_12515 [Kibdelosporangium persicum]|uniref:Uncharacterized protein n=1 Tax=Kibdelosporangium persicum TaxID=2698649 RepID=A0ABX2F9Q0_9PSEU|nr:hypothetical protein [Kibdelosporangium persicum]NRN68002.1 hypothetical protein [Kibdelosporangium persicum]